MSSIFIVVFLLFTSTLPAIILYLWIRKGYDVASQVALPWFLGALASGIVSLLIAAFIHSFFPFPGSTDNLGLLFFSVFIRVALVEESSRLFTLFPLLKTGNFQRNHGFAILGLAAGLGFAAAESTLYAMEDLNITLLRIITAAPLHGACGIRAGVALFLIKRQPGKAIYHILSAVIIHGTYNLIIISRAIPEVLAIPVALTALIISLPLIKYEINDKKDVIF